MIHVTVGCCVISYGDTKKWPLVGRPAQNSGETSQGPTLYHSKHDALFNENKSSVDRTNHSCLLGHSELRKSLESRKDEHHKGRGHTKTTVSGSLDRFRLHTHAYSNFLQLRAASRIWSTKSSAPVSEIKSELECICCEI